jgi:hypothetical protein
MLLLLLNLLQQGRLSRVVIVGAVLLFIAGVSLLVYFYRKYQRIEKEPEEDWNLSRRSLFVAAPSYQKTEEATDKAPVQVVPAPEMTPTQSGGTRELASGLLSTSSTSSITEPARQVETPASPSEPIETPQPTPAPPIELSPEPIGPISPIGPIEKSEPEQEPTVFDEEVWAGLDVEEPSPASAQSGETAPLQSITEPPRVARVDERSHREPFEAPTIEPLTPREQAAATRELRSSPAPRTPANRGEANERPSRDTVIFGTKPVEPPPPPMTAPSGRIAEPSHAGSRSYKASAGSILGLPAEGSSGPLILGESMRSADDAGIGALTNYGKDLSPKAGKGGTIALLIVVALLGGTLLLYLFVPSVHSRVSAYVGHLRGTDTLGSSKEKAQIFPSYRPEVNKNLVTARGAIDNISDGPLENLEVEVSLQRGADAPPDIRRVPVTPNPLAPNQRGTFEFEYDGKRDTGFVGYKITKLFSNGSEIKFRTPNPK